MQISKTTRRWGSASNKSPLEKTNLHTYTNLDTDIFKWLSALFFDNTLVTKPEVVIGKTGAHLMHINNHINISYSY